MRMLGHILLIFNHLYALKDFALLSNFYTLVLKDVTYFLVSFLAKKKKILTLLSTFHCFFTLLIFFFFFAS